MHAFCTPSATPWRLHTHSVQLHAHTKMCAQTRPQSAEQEQFGTAAATAAAVARQLAAELPRQYEAPRSLDWDLYSREITFDDPLTTISGRLAYRGMILTLALIVRACFEQGRATFVLEECIPEVNSDISKVRPKFKTFGTTRWGKFVAISGTDWFWLKEEVDGRCRVVRHESTWEQSPRQIWDAFTPGN